MSLILFKWTKRLTTLTIVLVSLYYFSQHKEDFYLISKISPLFLIALSLLAILSITINGNKLRLITESFRISLNSQEWLGLAFISSLGAYAPSGFIYAKDFEIVVDCLVHNPPPFGKVGGFSWSEFSTP